MEKMLNLAEKMKTDKRRFFKFVLKILYGCVIGSGTAFFIDDYADTPGWKGSLIF